MFGTAGPEGTGFAMDAKVEKAKALLAEAR